MRLTLLILTLLLLTKCSNTSREQTKQEPIETKLQAEHSDLILGERIDGPANIRDAVNGKIIFIHDDNTLVETTPKKENWFLIGRGFQL